MLNGWYKITRPTPVNQVVVEFCYNNAFQSGTVPALQEKGCLIEPVHIFTTDELLRVHSDAFEKGFNQALEKILERGKEKP
jgi:hypothetical protein